MIVVYLLLLRQHPCRMTVPGMGQACHFFFLIIYTTAPVVLRATTLNWRTALISCRSHINYDLYEAVATLCFL